jgi:LmbE family N-acetylglucosaminyl deacetylase
MCTRAEQRLVEKQDHGRQQRNIHICRVVPGGVQLNELYLVVSRAHDRPAGNPQPPIPSPLPVPYDICLDFARTFILAVLAATCLTPAFAQRELSGSAQARLSLDRLNVVGSVLMIAAHPDDENTALLAYLARGRKVRTGYLSLTRGEGGQNLIGAEQGDELGIIRTQELLAARRIDGAEQFFTRAIDFGFTKTPQECFEKWGRDKILSDVVWVIRRFRPDVIILRFSGTPRDGHGQHQASAILGREAFSAAADPKRFPEQLQWVQPWQAKRLMWNPGAFTKEQREEVEKMPNRISVDPGDYDPVLGHSYAEIAGMSRSMHRSQGMGAAERKGSAKDFLVTQSGPVATHDIFDGIDLSWNRIPGGAPVGQIVAEAAKRSTRKIPIERFPLLLKVEKLMAALHDPLVVLKRHELTEPLCFAPACGWTRPPTNTPSRPADRSSSIPPRSIAITWPCK